MSHMGTKTKLVATPIFIAWCYGLGRLSTVEEESLVVHTYVCVCMFVSIHVHCMYRFCTSIAEVLTSNFLKMAKASS